MMDRVIPVRINAHPTEPHNDFTGAPFMATWINSRGRSTTTTEK
ncbi:hypothetical protein ABIE06_004044 [Pantoea dispersa]|nr:hypothetical protein [Pantoea dispersa]